MEPRQMPTATDDPEAFRSKWKKYAGELKCLKLAVPTDHPEYDALMDEIDESIETVHGVTDAIADAHADQQEQDQ